MEIERLIKKLLISLAIVFVVFQPILVPVVYAVESWTGAPWQGDSWEGNSWKGDAWDGSDLQWEDAPWQGNDWQGNNTEGDRFYGDHWGGYDWQSPPWYLQGWSQNGYQGSPWENPGWSGNGSQGNPWTNPAWSGNGYLGSPWDIPGFAGNGSPISPGDGGSTEVDPTGITPPKGYNVAKYVANDVVGGQAHLIGNFQTYQNLTGAGYDAKFDYGGRMASNMLMNGLKLGVGDHAVFGAYDTYTHTTDGVQGVQDFRQARKAFETTDEATDLAESLRQRRNLANAANNGLSIIDTVSSSPKPPVGALSKLNVGAAAVGAGFSVFETGFKGAKAVDVLTSDATGAEKTSAVTDTGASLGDTLMNAGIVTSAIPGAQAVGGIMAASGAVLWGTSKLTGYIANKGGLKKAAKDLGNKIGEGWNKVKGWFS